MNDDIEDLRDAQSRAANAERILTDPLVQETLKVMRSQIVAQWSACPARDEAGREWCWRHLKALESFEAHLKAYMATGKLEAFNEKRGLMERALKIIKA